METLEGFPNLPATLSCRRSRQLSTRASRSSRAKCAGAVWGQGASVAVGVARPADSAAVPDDLVGEENPALAWQDFHEVALDTLCCRLSRERESLRKSDDMGVDHDAMGDAKGCPEHHVGGLARDAGKLKQVVHRRRYRAVPPLIE